MSNEDGRLFIKCALKHALRTFVLGCLRKLIGHCRSEDPGNQQPLTRHTATSQPEEVSVPGALLLARLSSYLLPSFVVEPIDHPAVTSLRALYYSWVNIASAYDTLGLQAIKDDFLIFLVHQLDCWGTLKSTAEIGEIGRNMLIVQVI